MPPPSCPLLLPPVPLLPPDPDFNEIMSPTFNMAFFDGFIRPSLYNAFFGWGLDFVWPFLLHYPLDKIAVVDEVCIYHPPSNPQRGTSLYTAEAPYDQKEEEVRRFAEYGYYDSALQKLGSSYQAVEVLGVVPKPPRREGLLETSSKVLQSRLGAFYPLLLLAQSGVIMSGCCAVFCLRLRRRRRSVGAGSPLGSPNGTVVGKHRIAQV